MARNAGFYMAGTWNEATGEIASLAMPITMAGYLDCCNKNTKEEKSIRISQLVNNNNKLRPAGDVICISQKINKHDPVMLKSLVMGNFSTEPKYELDAKSAQIIFGNWWELGKDSLKNMTDKQHQYNAEDAVGETEANRGTKRT